MARYRKKPVVVEAIKYNGSFSVELQKLLGGNGYDFSDSYLDGQGTKVSRLFVTTVDANRVCVPIGAYVVIDAKGFPYPCDAEIFEAGHEAVDA